jgi:hypothetical protein
VERDARRGNHYKTLTARVSRIFKKRPHRILKKRPRRILTCFFFENGLK